jgi:hypothetical protein
VAVYEELQVRRNQKSRDECVIEAFAEARDGHSPEFVICDAELGENFLAAVRRRGLVADDAEVNTALINLRKQNKLKRWPTTKRKPRDPDLNRYRNAVMNSARIVERQFRKNVDNIICDPQTRAQFDAIVQFMCPGVSAFEAQYAALNLRKSNRLRPEPVGQIIRAVASNVMNLLDLETGLADLPAAPGVYIFADEDSTLYAGKAINLRSRISDHISTWTFRDLIQQIRERRRANAFVVYHELPVEISARELAAYELELIRSRSPDHNRSGHVTEGREK